jgi:hypothetical protein
MSALLGAGNQTNGRPLLGGVGSAEDAGGVGATGSFGYVAGFALEAFARVSSTIASSGGWFGGGGAGVGGGPRGGDGNIDRNAE